MIQSRICRVACLLLAVGMGWAIGTTAQAQDPTAKVTDDQDPQLQAHVDFLIKALGSPNKIIRRSANQGLMAVGKPALPTLEAVAARNMGASSSLAARLARTIRERAEKQAARATADSDKPRNKKPRPGRGGPDQAQVAAILEKAGLDKALAPEIKVLMDQQRKAQNEFRARARTAGVDRASLQQERKAMTQTYRKKLQEILGPEGVKTFLKAMAERRNAAQAGDAKKKRKNKNKNDLNTGPQKF
jgi:hypothetical protein